MFPGSTPENRVATSLMGTPVLLSDYSSYHSVTVSNRSTLPAFMDALRQRSEVSSVDFSHTSLLPTACTIQGTCQTVVDNCPNDPFFTNGDQWSLVNAGQNGGTCGYDSGVKEAWRRLLTGSSETRLGVAGLGIDATHPELSGRLDLPVGPPFDPSVPQAYHETSMAGIVGANTNNGLGVAGIDHQCRLVDGHIAPANQIGGILLQLITSRGVQIINESFVEGYNPDCTPSQSGVTRKAVRDAFMLGAIQVAGVGQLRAAGEPCFGIPLDGVTHWPAGLKVG